MRTIFFEQPDPLALRRRLSGWRKLWVWSPALLAIAVIAVESTGTFSSDHTSEWLRPAVEAIFGRMGDKPWSEIHHLIRKSGHFLGYGMVALTFLRAWLLTLGQKQFLGRHQWYLGACLLAVFCTAMVAGADELHQSFLPTRTGMLSDVGIDTCGALLACSLCWLIFWRSRSDAPGLSAPIA